MDEILIKKMSGDILKKERFRLYNHTAIKLVMDDTYAASPQAQTISNFRLQFFPLRGVSSAGKLHIGEKKEGM